MATFRFIKGKEPKPSTPEATKYELYEDLGGGESKKIATQEFRTNLNIPSAFLANGEPATTTIDVSPNKYTTERYPIAKETENGFAYYYRLNGTMEVNTGIKTYPSYQYEGVLYVDEFEQKKFKVSESGFIGDYGEGIGIYLSITFYDDQTTTKKVKIYSLSDNHDTRSVIIKTLKVTSSRFDVYRTTYIPLDVLKEDVLLFDVGPLEGEDSEGNVSDVAMVCFFDENLDFVVGKTFSDILTLYPDFRTEDNKAPIELNRYHLNGLAGKHKDTVKYVVFCSDIWGTEKTAPECTFYNETVCFPLFTHTRDEFGSGQEHTFYVKAIGDGFYYDNSEPKYLDEKVNF